MQSGYNSIKDWRGNRRINERSIEGFGLMEEKSKLPENMEDWGIEEYKAAYKLEKKKSVVLSGRLADAIAQALSLIHI